MSSLYRGGIREERKARNVSPETHSINEAAAAWARARWPGCRVIRELALGDARVDLAVVTDRDLIAIETKARRDRPDGVKRQVTEYGRFCPEVWLCIDQRWIEHAEARTVWNLVIFDGGKIVDGRSGGFGARPQRSQLVMTRQLEIMWRDELVKIGQQYQAVETPAHKSWTVQKLQDHLAMMLTGNEIGKGVASQLRRRPLDMVGLSSDPPASLQSLPLMESGSGSTSTASTTTTSTRSKAGRSLL